MSLHDTIEKTAQGLGYDLVDVERTSGGLLRVIIDWPWAPGIEAVRAITAEDCERVTRQLQFVLEVDAVAYSRLEVSSPGIDRILKTDEDFARFEGEVIDLILKDAIGAVAKEAQMVAGNQGETKAIAANRKKFRGVLGRAETGWQIVWSDEPTPKPGVRVSKKRALAPLQALGFVLSELKEARLAPIVNFNGRSV